MKGARIGQRVIIGQNVNVDGGTVIGDNVKIQNNVSVYTGTVIEDDVFLGPSCVLTNVTNPRSQVIRHSLYETTHLKRGCYDWRQCDDCVRGDHRTLCICRGRFGRDQERCRFCVGGWKPRASGRMDEPARTSSQFPRFGRGDAVPGKRLSLQGSRARRPSMPRSRRRSPIAGRVERRHQNLQAVKRGIKA